MFKAIRIAYIVCLCRLSGQPTNVFEELKDLLENWATVHSEFLIFGDLNFQLKKPTVVTTNYIVS